MTLFVVALIQPTGVGYAHVLYIGGGKPVVTSNHKKRQTMTQTLLTIATVFGLTTFATFGQTAMDVADNTLKVGAFGEEVFYYGFAEGDQLIFNFEEVNGKELKEIEIIEMPSSSKFMDYKTKKIENKTINITSTGILTSPPSFHDEDLPR